MVYINFKKHIIFRRFFVKNFYKIKNIFLYFQCEIYSTTPNKMMNNHLYIN